jgi:1-acyl-sn-glycerol-3-phosphate acyltransferase
MTDEPIFERGRLTRGQLEWLKRVFQFLFWIFTRIEVRGLENLPAAGGLILCPNHLSRFDTPFVFICLPTRRFTGFAGHNYRRNWFFRWILTSVDMIWVRRGAITPSTIKAAFEALRAEGWLGVAPEGTRSPTGALQKGRSGAAFLAAESGAPILPIAITGTELLSRNMPRLRRTTLTVTYGKPFTLPPLERGRREAQLEEYTLEIMCRIAALLPEQYRGVYAGEKRVAALVRPAAAPARG